MLVYADFFGGNVRRGKKTDSKSFFKQCAGEFLGCMSLVEIQSDYEMIISGCRGIVEYTETTVVVETVSGVISVCGMCLCLDVFRGDMLSISGKIISVSFGGDLC